MDSSPIVVGRMLVDADHADHADLASSLLSAQRALAGMEAAHPSKGKGRADDHTSDASLSDEEYALKIQKEFLQDTLRVMEDFRLARSLGAGGETVHQHSNIVDRTALDYLRVLLTTPATTSKLGSPPPQLTIADLRMHGSPPLADDASLFSETEDGVWIVDEPAISPDFSHEAAGEHRKVLLAASVRAGLAGPSDSTSGSTSLASPHEPDSQPTEEDVELDEETAGEAPTGDIREILGEQFGFPTVYCIVCGDLVVGEPTLHAPCDHNLCVDCVRDLVTASIRDESLYPPRCCQNPLSRDALAPFLTIRLEANFDAKRAEYDTPVTRRVFCPAPTCSAFLGSSEGAGETVACRRCNTSVCISCKQNAHAGETCQESTAMSSVRRLAQENRWQTCPQCHAIVEKTMGCNHITCRCTSNFCYECGGRMGSCKCR